MSFAEGSRSRNAGGSSAAGLAAIQRVETDSAYLYQIIEAISAGPDLKTILRRILRLLTEATHCHAAFIYFLQRDRLVLGAASPRYAHLEGEISFPVDEGLTGWVASRRQPAFIRDHASGDPRFHSVPQLDEDLESLASVPILGRSREVIGAITLSADAPHEFDQSDLDFLEHTASLVAGAVENARLYEQATERVALLTELSELARRVAATSGLAELLPMVVDRTRHLIGATRCEVYVLETPARLVLGAASPDRKDAPALDPQQLWYAAVDGRLEGAEAEAVREKLWGPDATGTAMVVPLLAAEERLGILCVLLERASTDAHSAMIAIASDAALAIKRHQLIDSLKEKNLVKDFFEALSRGQVEGEEVRATAVRLRCDLEARHVVLQAAPWTPPIGRERVRLSKVPPQPAPEWTQLAARLENRLRAELPVALFDRRERSVRGLLRLPADSADIAELVRRIFSQVGGNERGPLAIGLSNVCEGASSFARGFEEAAAAVQIGALLRHSAGVVTYEELGPYRYVLSAQDKVRDRYQGQVQRLIEYQRRRGTELLATLEAYLDHQGNLVRTAKVLYMHPNTLRQRLGRIERVAELDLDQEDWLSLAMAIKAVKLRLMQTSAGNERRDAHGGGD